MFELKHHFLNTCTQFHQHESQFSKFINDQACN